MINENILTEAEIKDIKISGRCLTEAMNEVKKAVRPGITTKALDQIAEEEIRKRGCIPSFLNYYVEGAGQFPASLCISVNEEIVHGIPSEERVLKDGDLVSLDLGVGYKGIFTDMAATVIAGQSDAEKDKLIEVTKKALMKGIERALAGHKIGDIGHTVENYVLGEGLDVVRDYVGHGIGKRPHMWPQIPNFGKAGSGPKICENMALAIEPMVTIGDSDTVVHDNNWTVSTASGLLAAHFEHTVIIQKGKPVIVTC